MAVGSDGIPAVRSYIAVGKESTFGTYASATTAVAFVSSSFKTEVETQKLDQIGINRGFSGRVTLGKNVSGTLETFFHPQESTLLVAAALGGPLISTAISTSAIHHSISAGNFDTTTAIQSLSFNERKGTTNVFRYSGGRVNTLKLSGSIGEPIMLSADMVFKDSTLLSDDIANTLTYSAVQPFTFVQGVFRYAATEGSLTSTVNEPIQGFELTINNNVISDENARSLGTITVDILPVTRREIEFKVTNRWDTTTTFNRFIQATQASVELYFTVGSITSDHGYQCRIRLPKVFNVTGDTELSGADEILSSEITYDVVLDGNAATTTSREIGVTIVNTATAY